MHNTGSVDSIANVVFSASKTRYACAISSFLFHGVSWIFKGGIEGETVNRSQVAEVLYVIENGETLTIGIIADRTSLTTEEVRTLFAEGAKRTPEFALSKGIIHEIRELALPNDAKIFTFRPE